MTNLVPERLKIDDDLYLRRAQLRDASMWFRLIDANRAHLESFGDLAGFTIRDAVRERQLRQDAVVAGKELDYWIVADDEVVGNVGMSLRGSGTGLMGYWLAEDAQGYGYATRSARRLMQHGVCHRGVAQVELMIEPSNAPSQAVAERIGAVLVHEADLPIEKYDIWRASQDAR
ncbi:MAG TPA: GNAT family protein [Candidatus Saccharimonadales bacterium]